MKKIVLLFLLIAVANNVAAQVTLSGKVTGQGNITVVTGPPAGGLSSPLPTTVGVWTEMKSVTTNTNQSASSFGICPAGRQGDGTGFCGTVYTNWSGGIADQIRNRMIIYGGGHGDYSFNELYYIDFHNTVSGAWAPIIRRANPGSQTATPCPGNAEVALDGSAASRHTYNGLVWDPYEDAMMVTGGALAGSGTSCLISTGQWLLSLGSFGNSCQPNCTATWTRQDNSATGVNQIADENVCDYEVVSRLEWCVDSNGNGNNFWSFDPVAKVFNCTRCGHSDGINSSGMGGVIDQFNRLLVGIGGGNLAAYDLRNPANPPVDHSGNAGCSPVVGLTFPGVAFDDNRDTIWVEPGTGGNTVYEINASTGISGTWTCTAHTYGSTQGVDFPQAGTVNGIFGRFRYFQQDDIFVYCPSELVNCWFLRVDPVATPDTNSFTTIAAGPGVTFSSPLTNSTPVTSGNGYYIGSDATHPTIQSALSPTWSGTTAKFTVMGKTSAGASGFFRMSLNTACGQRGVHEHCDIYYQYRVRSDPGMFTNFGDTSNTTTTKFDIMHNNAFTCGGDGDAEDTFQIWQGLGQPSAIPIMYSGCGDQPFGTQPAVPNQTYVGFNPPYFLQQGDSVSTGYNCNHGTTYLTDPGCFHFSPNVWYTVYGHIHIGDLTTNGANGPCNVTSLVAADHCWNEMWIAAQGQSLKQLNNTWNMPVSDFISPYDTIDLLPYATGKNPALDHPPANRNYCCLVVGTQPLVAPTGATPASGQHPVP